MPAAYVKPYVARQKNDAADAEPVCEAVTRPTMRFVAVKSPEQQSVRVIHRTRTTLMRHRIEISRLRDTEWQARTQFGSNQTAREGMAHSRRQLDRSA